MKILTDLKQNETHCEVSFQDTIRNRTRDGIVSFIAPCFYHFRVRKSSTSDYSLMLLALVVPTVPGQCRILFSVNIPVSVSRFIPKWFDHALSMRFLDSDLWIHEEEVAVRGRKNLFFDSIMPVKEPHDVGMNYKLMTSSDTGCAAWRLWWHTHMSVNITFKHSATTVSRPLNLYNTQ